jgi:hypothetical protein
MKNDSIKIDEYIYNIFFDKNYKFAGTKTQRCRIVVWCNNNPVDSFYICKFDKKWVAWTCNTISEIKINLRLKFEDYFNKAV